MKIGDVVLVRGVVEQINNKRVILKNEGGYFETVKSEIVISKKEKEKE